MNDNFYFVRSMREAFGDDMTIEDQKVAKKKQREFIIDPNGNGDSVLDNVFGFFKTTVRDWIAVKENPPLIVIVKRYDKPRTLLQNGRMWAGYMLALEKSGLTRPGTDDTMSKEAWHYYLRIEFGYIVGTTTRFLPGGVKVECPDPQPTAAGEDGQMTTAEHNEYMGKVEAFMFENGVEPLPYEADDYSGTMGVAA